MRLRALCVAITALCGTASVIGAQETPAAGAASVADSAPPKPKKPGRPTPARQIGSSMPNLVLTSRAPGSLERRSNLVEIRVEIDESGLPDLSTLRVTGSGAADNRSEIVRWLEATKFEPARDAEGNAVRGQYRLRLSVGGT